VEAAVVRPRTIMEVFKMLPETTLAEVINNQLFMSPAPSPIHQRAVKKLLKALDGFIDSRALGETFISPIDLFLDETSNAVQPDLVFISKSDQIIIDKDGLHGVPSFIIEILSPGNPQYDLVIKKELYEKFGVKEYWIVNPDTKNVIGYTLQNKKYGIPVEKSGEIPSALLSYTFTF